MQSDEVRAELEKMRDRLTRHDAERGYMADVMRIYEKWLGDLTHGVAAAETPPTVTAKNDTMPVSPQQPKREWSSDRPRRATKGTTSIELAVKPAG